MWLSRWCIIFHPMARVQAHFFINLNEYKSSCLLKLTWNAPCVWRPFGVVWSNVIHKIWYLASLQYSRHKGNASGFVIWTCVLKAEDKKLCRKESRLSVSVVPKTLLEWNLICFSSDFIEKHIEERGSAWREVINAKRFLRRNEPLL